MSASIEFAIVCDLERAKSAIPPGNIPGTIERVTLAHKGVWVLYRGTKPDGTVHKRCTTTSWRLDEAWLDALVERGAAFDMARRCWFPTEIEKMLGKR